MYHILVDTKGFRRWSLKYDVSETGSLSVFKRKGKILILFGPLIVFVSKMVSTKEMLYHHCSSTLL
jgi:hypothetical protein